MKSEQKREIAKKNPNLGQNKVNKANWCQKPD